MDKGNNCRIFKYTLDITEEQTIEMPEAAAILSVGFQNDNLCLWALVDESKDKVPRKFHVYGTGQPTKPLNLFEQGTIAKDYISFLTFIGTCITSSFVWHIFENKS